jgi:hypothetical protein
MTQEDHQSLELETPVGKFKSTGKDINTIVTFLTFVAILLFFSWAYSHRSDAIEAQAKVASSLEKHNDGIDKMIKAQKENTCILSLEPEKRQAEFNSPNSLCKRMVQ